MVALWLVVLVLIVLVLGLSRRVRDLSKRLDQRPVGGDDMDSPIRGPRIGSTLELAPVAKRGEEGRDRIVLFLNSSCGPCHVLADELAAAREGGYLNLLAGTELVVVTDDLGAKFYGGLGADEVVVQPANDISTQLGINATPYGIAVDAAGVVRWSGIAGDFDDLLAMAAAFTFDAEGRA